MIMHNALCIVSLGSCWVSHYQTDGKKSDLLWPRNIAHITKRKTQFKTMLHYFKILASSMI